ncbi:MAG: Ig-like domain-containing protein [Longimicrobiales bacterium]
MLNVPTLYEPIIEVCPTRLDFGEVSVGGCATKTLTIMDYDGCHLHVSGVLLGHRTDPAFSFPDLPCFPMLVPSESSKNLDVSFRPVRKGFVTGSVEIACDDPRQPMAHVALCGVGV